MAGISARTLQGNSFRQPAQNTLSVKPTVPVNTLQSTVSGAGTSQPIGGNTGSIGYYPGRTQAWENTRYPSGGSGSYADSGSAGALQPAYDPGDLAYLDDQAARLNAQMGSADRAYSSGLTQLSDSYNREVSGANSRQSRALQDFGVKREDTTRSKDQALSRVDTNARTLANSLRQRIGLASGSGSSAYQITAPGAVARDATQNRTGVVENYGVNFRNLDTGEKRVKEDFLSLLGDLEAQRKSRQADFEGGILDRKNQISGSLAEVARQRALLLGGGYTQAKAAMAPYTSAIDTRQAEIDGLFDKYRTPFNVKAVDTSTPTLRDYMVDRPAINANQTQGQDPTSPYGQFLRPDEEEGGLY